MAKQSRIRRTSQSVCIRCGVMLQLIFVALLILSQTVKAEEGEGYEYEATERAVSDESHQTPIARLEAEINKKESEQEPKIEKIENKNIQDHTETIRRLKRKSNSDVNGVKHMENEIPLSDPRPSAIKEIETLDNATVVPDKEQNGIVIQEEKDEDLENKKQSPLKAIKDKICNILSFTIGLSRILLHQARKIKISTAKNAFVLAISGWGVKRAIRRYGEVFPIYACLVVFFLFLKEHKVSIYQEDNAILRSSASEILDVVLIKVGGSSITNKAVEESLNYPSLDWFAKTVSKEVSASFRPPGYNTTNSSNSTNSAFVIIHGAGSFGHHSAKAFGLKGQTNPPGKNEKIPDFVSDSQRFMMQGLAQTRLSVQTLNRAVVSAFIKHGINAVGISPFSIPGLCAHGGDETAIASLLSVVRSTLKGGLIPVLHGDACLYGERGAGILSGDTLVEILGKAPWVSRVVFLTDVDGVFTKDPRIDPRARLLRTIQVEPNTANIVAADFEASGSSHAHDVTGGLETKLKSASSIAALGKNVTIARCGSVDGGEAIRKNGWVDRATVLICSERK